MRKSRSRRSRRYRGRRRSYRRKTRTLRRKVASINRRLAAEVKKNDHAVFVNASSFTQLTTVGIRDHAYLYPVLDATMAQGTQMDDIIGQSIKIKYLYLGLHLQQQATAVDPITLRVMVVQDRNYRRYNNGVPTATEMFSNLFGLTNSNADNSYVANIDATLLPINPLEPGRFRVIRDFKMCVAPGWKSDNYKKILILQSRTNSHGRIYFGSNETTVYPSSIGTENSTSLVVFYYDVGTVLPTLTLIDGTTVSPTTRTVNGVTYPVYVLTETGTSLSQADYFLRSYPGGGITVNGNAGNEPANQDISFTASRNGIYLLLLRQSTPVGIQSDEPAFGLSIQSRLAYYDN